MNGIISVLKPPGMTSHDVVSFIRRKLNIKRAGHTGTLDPNAAGVLPICIGKATKVTQFITNNNKKYRCELTLGSQTDTQDKYGEFINHSNKIVTEEEITKVFNTFLGKIQQVPPMYSAVKQNGKKLYELARKGIEVERKEREVTIYSLDIIKIWDNRKIIFDVECSKGTYVRTLCNDIGIELGTYGYMSFLLRTNVGHFNIRESNTLEQIEEYVLRQDIKAHIFPLDYPLMDYDSIIINDINYKKVINGVKVNVNSITDYIDTYKPNDLVRVYHKQEFLGIGIIISEKNKKVLKMGKVLV